MNLFDKLKNNRNDTEKEIINNAEINHECNIVTMNNYMLADIKKEQLNKNTFSLAISKIKQSSPLLVQTVDEIKHVVESNAKNHHNNSKLYRVTNLGKDDSLKEMKKGKTFWGAIKTKEGKSKMAKLKEVNVDGKLALDPVTIMMTVALSNIEADLGEIKELNKKILSFLEEEKESEIEADLELLNHSIIDFQYNLENEQYLANNHKQVMDIKRTANKNMLFYQKQINDFLAKERIMTTSNVMNSLLNDLVKKFKYYRMSLYIYSFSTLMEILLLGNYQSDYLLAKRDELDILDAEYSQTYNTALNYIKKNADKSLESNLLSGIGSAGKVIGNLAEKVDVIKNKNIDTWFNEKGDNLKQKGESLKNQFSDSFDDIKMTNATTFIKKIEQVDSIYNKTKEIYFDSENIYLQM